MSLQPLATGAWQQSQRFWYDSGAVSQLVQVMFLVASACITKFSDLIWVKRGCHSTTIAQVFLMCRECERDHVRAWANPPH
jgi:hypothetical protein